METTFIYALCEPGTRTVRYIGKANDPKRRFINHLSDSVKAKTYLGNWLRSLYEKPSLVILCEVPVDQHQIEEMRYISAARMLGMNLVNSTDGGEGIHNPSAETRAKMSANVKGEKNPTFGKKPWNFGEKTSPETKAKLSAARLGKRPSSETCAKISTALKGEKNHQFGKKGEKCSHFGKKRTSSSSKFYGVSITPRKEWEVKLKINGKRKFLGSFKNEVDAARAYDKAVMFYGTSNPLNFPNE